VLVNGSEGIGTGWSTSVTTYNPRDIINCLREMIAGNMPTEIHPWYRGFSGEIQIKTANTNTPTYILSGKVEVIDDTTVIISELPVGKWTSEYKQYLESVLIGGPGAAAAAKEDGAAPVAAPFIKDFKENHTDTTVLFTLTIPPEKLVEIMNEKGGLHKKLKLDVTVSTSNMHMFDSNGVIKKYDG
jgi:DNA topoisomerase II